MRATSNGSGFFLIIIIVSIIGFVRAYYKSWKLGRTKNDENQYYVDAQGNKYIYKNTNE